MQTFEQLFLKYFNNFLNKFDIVAYKNKYSN